MQYWYAYRHVDGNIIPKRWFDDDCIVEADESDFVVQTTKKFKADGRAMAYKMAVKLLGDE